MINTRWARVVQYPIVPESKVVYEYAVGMGKLTQYRAWARAGLLILVIMVAGVAEHMPIWINGGLTVLCLGIAWTGWNLNKLWPQKEVQ